ncbi:sarcoplasmic calcium-binding protein-like [Ruditapes philippinarum]|uniref:sarcoplasmic calcium-binding protein-like n=1 Tax=Ruditapes philippinarum TaxID=129788 RepID=UPI00295AC7E1|nr:sarcoplasmic calcium-binding protein-like [Ruditapes philippinarum]
MDSQRIKMYFMVALCLNDVLVSVCGEEEQDKANGYLIEKWEQMFYVNDINRDAKLTMDDAKQFEKYYKDYLVDQQLKSLTKRIDKVYRTILLNNKKEIAKEDFVDMMKQKYESDKNTFIEMVREYISEWCKAMDLNGDKNISKQEFIMDMFAEGNKNARKEAKFFLTFKPKNGQIPVDEIISDFIRFATESNPSKIDIIKNENDSNV